MDKLNTLDLALIIFVWSANYTPVIAQASCPSAIADAEKVDCAGDVSPVTEGICRARSCVWCTTSTANTPYCFYDDTSYVGFKGFLFDQCKSCSDCAYAKDCHPEPGATEANCIARGCQWCSYPSSISCGPMCMYGASNDLIATRLSCDSCSTCTARVDCHPESGATHGKCLTRGCRWCPDPGDPKLPACIHSDINNFITEARTVCKSCSDCPARVDCHPEPGATSTACLAKNCIWCPTDNEPHCIYGGLTDTDQNTCTECSSCNTKMACPPNIAKPSALQCHMYGCLWCPMKSFGNINCVFKLL